MMDQPDFLTGPLVDCLSSPQQYHIVSLEDEEVLDHPTTPTTASSSASSTVAIPPATPPRSLFGTTPTPTPTTAGGAGGSHCATGPSATGLAVKVGFLERTGGSLNQQLVFGVETQGLTARSFSVRRTYDDFEALRGLLKRTYPGHLVPPLAAKKVLDGLNLSMGAPLSERDIAKKQKHLQSFMTRLAEHPRLAITAEVAAFLQMTHFRAPQSPIEEQLASIEKLAGSLSRDFRNALGDVASPDLRRFGDPQLQHLLNLKDLADAFEARLGAVYRGFHDLSDRSRQSAAVYGDLKGQLAGLAESETNLQGFFMHLAAVCGGLGLLYHSDASHEDKDFLQEFNEFLLLTADMIDVIRHNVQTLVRFHEAQEELVAARQHHAQLMEEQRQPVRQKVQWIFSFGEDIETRLDKAVGRREAAESAVLALRQRVDQLAAHFMEEMKLFNTWKVLGFQQTFMRHIDRKIEFHQQAISAWNSLRHDIREVDASLGSVSVGWWPQERAIASASPRISTSSSSLSMLPSVIGSLFETPSARQDVAPSLGESTLGHQPGFSYPSLK